MPLLPCLTGHCVSRPGAKRPQAYAVSRTRRPDTAFVLMMPSVHGSVVWDRFSVYIRSTAYFVGGRSQSNPSRRIQTPRDPGICADSHRQEEVGFLRRARSRDHAVRSTQDAVRRTQDASSMQTTRRCAAEEMLYEPADAERDGDRTAPVLRRRMSYSSRAAVRRAMASGSPG